MLISGRKQVKTVMVIESKKVYGLEMKSPKLDLLMYFFLNFIDSFFTIKVSGVKIQMKLVLFLFC